MHEAADHAEVLVATTWSCNLRCTYCFVQDRTCQPGHRQRMGAVGARRVVEALDKGLTHCSTIGIHLYGGEPLTNVPALRAMVGRASEAPGRFSFSITTNGTVVNDEVFELLEKGRFQVVLSIDGPAGVHDEHRRTQKGGGTHATTRRFLRELRARTNCWVRGSSVVRAGWRLRDAQAYLRTLPVDVIKAQAVRLPASHPLSLDAVERNLYLDDLDAAGDKVIADLEAGRLPKDDRFSARVLQLLTGEPRARFCGAGAGIFGIRPNGDVMPCVLLDSPEDRLGDIGDVDAGWVEKGRRWQDGHGPRSECRECDALPLCGGGCPAMLAVCGAEECDLVRKTCAVARRIFRHFEKRPEALLALAGVQ